MSLEKSIAAHIGKYSNVVGGSGSLRVTSALIEGGFSVGVRQLGDECTLSAIKAMNKFGLSHAENLAAYSVLFLIAGTAVGELVIHPSTRDLGMAIANKVPVLAAGWATSSSEPVEKLDVWQEAERMAPKYNIQFSASQERAKHGQSSDDLRTPGELLNKHGKKDK